MYKPYLMSKPKEYPLDGLLVAEAFSVARQLTSKHKIPFQAKRTSDNAVFKTRFSNGELDIGQFLSWANGSNTLLDEVYGVNGSVFTADNDGKKPRIINAGILDRDFDIDKFNRLFPTFASIGSLILVNNGNFVNTSGWSTSYSKGLSVSNNTLTATGDGTGNQPLVYQILGTSWLNKRLAYRVKVRSINASCQRISLISEGAEIVYVDNPVQNTWYTLNIVRTLTSSGNIAFGVRHQYADAATANNKSIEVQEAVSIDATNYGKPCGVWDGTNDALWTVNNSFIDIVNQPLYLSSTINIDVAGVDSWILTKNTDANANIQYALQYSDAQKQVKYYQEGVADNIASAAANSISKGIQTIQSAKWENNLMQIYDDGVASGTTDTYAGTLTTRNNLYIGCRGQTSNAQTAFFKGKISEVFILKGNPKQTKFEANIKKYYGIGA